MMRRFLITLALLQAAIACMAQVKETVVNDFFSDNISGWPEVAIPGEYSSALGKGVYELQYEKPTGSQCFDVPVEMLMNANYFIEMVGRINYGENSSGLGLVWGKGGGGYYSFAVTSDGRFYVRKARMGKGAEYLLGPLRSGHIKTKGAENRLRVQHSKNELSFFINDQYVGHLPDQDPFGLNAGVILYGRQRSEITHFGAFGTRNVERMQEYYAAVKVRHFKIKDDNRDHRVQPGETITLELELRNNGHGRCDSLLAKVHSMSKYITVLGGDRLFDVNLGYNQNMSIPLVFKVDDHCPLEKLAFSIDIIDRKGHLAETVPFMVPMYTFIDPIDPDELSLSLNIEFAGINTSDINKYQYNCIQQHMRYTMALVIGLEHYSQLPDAKYASNDAKIFTKYLQKTINIRPQNIITLANSNATLARIREVVKQGGDLHVLRDINMMHNLVVYFSGLGMCEPGKNDPYLMFYDSKASDPVNTGYRLSEFVKSLRSYFDGNIIIIFETSFSGLDRDGVSFMPGDGEVRGNPVFPMVDNRTCVMYATSAGRGYNPLKESTQHGLFTHYILNSFHVYGKNRSTLDMSMLYNLVNRGMHDDKESYGGYQSSPRMDCIHGENFIFIK